jgi:hypothetical protein
MGIPRHWRRRDDAGVPATIPLEQIASGHADTVPDVKARGLPSNGIANTHRRRLKASSAAAHAPRRRPPGNQRLTAEHAARSVGQRRLQQRVEGDAPDAEPPKALEVARLSGPFPE